MCMPMKADSFTLKNLQQLHKEIVSFKLIVKPDSKQLKNISQKLKAYVQMVIWGDKYNSDFVDYFCEVKSLETMVQIFVNIKIESVLISVIQGISMLLINLSRQQSLHYFLSNSALMKFQMIKFATIDPQLSEYYINFLKSVSIRLNLMTVQLFYNQKYSNFPLLWQAIKFYNHPETLIRNTSNNIVLSVAKIEDDKVKRYLSSFPFIIYYSHLAYSTFDTCIKIDKAFNLQDLPFAKLNQYYDQLSNLVIYFEDLLSTAKEANTLILNAYIQGVIVYMNYAIFSDFRTFFSPKMAMFFFSLLMRQSGCSKLVDFIVLMLMGRYLKKSFINKLEEIEAIHRLKSHSRKWNFHGFWDDFIPELSQYTKTVFNQEPLPSMDLGQSMNILAQTFYFKSPPQTPRTNHEQKISKQMIESDLLSQYTTKQSQKQQQMSDTQSQYPFNYAQSKPITPYQKQINKLQRIHSVQIDQDIPSQLSFSILGLTEIIKIQLEDTLIDLQQMEDNHTRKTILGFLNSGDEHLIILTIDFLTCILKSKVISPHILNFAGLDLDKAFDFYNLETIGRILTPCFEMFRMGGLVYRLQTYKKAVNIIDRLFQKPHILQIHKQTLISLCKQYIKQVYNFLSSQLPIATKIQSYEIGRRQSMKSIIGIGFLQIISSPSILTEQQKYIAVYFILRNLKAKIFKQPIKSLNLSKIVIAKPGYSLNEQILISPILSACELFDSHSEKGKKCYLLLQDNYLILVQKSNNKVIFVMDVIRIKSNRDPSNVKKNMLRVRQNDSKWVTLKLLFNDQKTAQKQHQCVQQMKNKRGQQILTQIVNQLIQYQLTEGTNK